jgi:hypothetical protein
MREAINRPVYVQTCGVNGNSSCAIYDLDESGVVVGTSDLLAFRAFLGLMLTDAAKCPSCPLACSAGSARTCN